MNPFSDDLYMAVKNNQKLQETFLNGLHRIARLTLGFKAPNQASGKDVLLWGCAYPTEGFTPLPGSGNATEFSSGFLNSIYNTIQENGIDDDELQELHEQAVPSEALQALLDEFWQDMVTYAKSYAKYSADWQRLIPLAS